MALFKNDKNGDSSEQENGFYTPKPPAKESERLSESLCDTMIAVRTLFSNSSDFVERRVTLGGVSLAILMCEGMVSLSTFSKILAVPLMNAKLPEGATPDSLLSFIRSHSLLGADQKEFYTYGELFTFIMSGFAVILIEGKALGVACGIQGFSFRSISEPSSEINVRGSREGFVEALRINLTMVRRRIKSPLLTFEMRAVGTRSKTDICLVYMSDSVSSSVLDSIRKKLAGATLDVVLDSAYLEPFLEERPYSLFSGIGSTERPDTLCAKISEGRVAILVDGTPFALVLPYLFSENFQSLDDYTHRPYYAFVLRFLKYTSFFLTILLPGAYVALATYHPELFPDALLFNIARSEADTPFPLMFEALIIHFVYELMREAGLRLPRPIGHAVGIVGALVIGDAAVTAGIIGSPMVMVVAITAICSFVVPSLYQSVTVLRFSFILLGGLLGLFGITLGLALMFGSLCSLHPMGVPETAPASPFGPYSMRDTLFRIGWRRLGKKTMRIQEMPGSKTGYHSPQ